MSEKGLETCLSKPLFLYGAECAERLEVARRFHEHGFFAAGAFVEARLSAIPRALREGALFGPVVDFFSHSGVLGETCWLSQAQGGTLLVDELDCLCPVLQQRFMEWLKEEYHTGQMPSLRVILASQYEPAFLVHSGGLTPEFSAWIQALDTGQCLGPERIRAVQNFSAGNGVPGLAGLAAVLEPVMRSYVEAGLEAGGHGLYATIIGEVERPLITMVLRHTGGNQVRASALLGVNRNTLRKRIRELQITLPTKREML